MNNEKRLLCSYEILEIDPKTIKEGIEKDGKVRLKGIFQRADVCNQNGRIYPRGILERECRNYTKFINENRALGELDHPDTSVVELKNVSHIVRELSMDNEGVVHGVLELLNTPQGKVAQSLVQDGVRLGISSRGVGSTTKKGDFDLVSDDFAMIAFDLVSEPSTSQAFLFAEGRRITTAELSRTFSRSDRIDRLINDILYLT